MEDSFDIEISKEDELSEDDITGDEISDGMEDSEEMESSGQEPEGSGATQLPLNFLTIGEIENNDVRVYLKQDVYRALEKYALEDVEHERGTILLGDYCENLGKIHVVISNYVEAKYTDASASTLTFTHETWEYVHQEQDSKYPDKKIIGWQHTHPSYGIFLSNYDLFIQENFFDLPFQVAYVIDPVQGLRGFFQWKEGKTEKLKGFYVYDEVGKPIKLEQPKKPKEKAAPTAQKGGSFSILTLLALLLAAGSLAACLLLWSALNEQKQLLAAQEADRQQLAQTVSEQAAALANLQSTAVIRNDDGVEEERTVTVTELLELLEEQQATIDSQQATIAGLQEDVTLLQEQLDGRQGEYVLYTVQPGDTLVGICSQLGIDYWKFRDSILGINRISNENLILVGQVVVFPTSMIEE